MQMRTPIIELKPGWSANTAGQCEHAHIHRGHVWPDHATVTRAHTFCSERTSHMAISLSIRPCVLSVDLWVSQPLSLCGCETMVWGWYHKERLNFKGSSNAPHASYLQFHLSLLLGWGEMRRRLRGKDYRSGSRSSIFIQQFPVFTKSHIAPRSARA